MTPPPSLAEISAKWGATASIPEAAAAFGVSKSHAYDLVARGEFPARVLKVGSRYRVVTASIIAVLSNNEDRSAAA